MRAILNEDIIIHLTMHGDVEVGNVPRGVGLERLRFDGQKVVDLATLNQIWVKHHDGSFELHAIEVEGSQLVQMTYLERRRLTLDSGIIRVLSDIEYQEMLDTDKKRIIGARLHQYIHSEVADIDGQIQNIYKFIFALIVYARQEPSALANFFDTIIPHIIDTYPLSRVQDELIEASKEIKKAVDKYYAEIDAL